MSMRSFEQAIRLRFSEESNFKFSDENGILSVFVPAAVALIIYIGNGKCSISWGGKLHNHQAIFSLCG